MKNNYYKTLPKKPIGAGTLFFNTAGDLLIVHPTYKDRWEIPGGVVEDNESIKQALEREIKEELGLIIEVQQLLCMDYWPATDERPDTIQCIFYGGILTEKQINAIQLPEDELSHFQFLDPKSDIVKNRPRIGPRIQQCLDALEHKTCYYLEEGQRPSS